MFIDLELTNHCNTTCAHCPRAAITRRKGRMTPDTFNGIVAKLRPYKEMIGGICFSGMGEPTLHSHLANFTRVLSRDFIVSMTTNLTGITRPLVDELEVAGMRSVTASFNGHTQLTYSAMTGGLDLDQATTRLRMLVESQIEVIANVSVTRLTAPYLDEIRQLLNEIGVARIVWSLCHNRGGYLDAPDVCFERPAPLDDYCDVYRRNIFVTWEGDVLACCHDLAAECVIGNLPRDGFDKIVIEKRYTAPRPSICAVCNDPLRHMATARESAILYGVKPQWL